MWGYNIHFILICIVGITAIILVLPTKKELDEIGTARNKNKAKRDSA